MEKDRCIAAADIVVERIKDGKPEILLIKRKADPFKDKWALPGGIVEAEEEVQTAAQRELKEETSLDLNRNALDFINYFDAPDRDPRGRVISFGFGTAIKEDVSVKAGDDAAEAQWFALDQLPALAFDHRSIIANWEER